MKRAIAVLTLSAVSLWAGVASAQAPATAQQQRPGAAPPASAPPASAPPAPVAGRTPLGVTVVEMEAIVVGWSTKRDVLGKNVVNDRNEKIGKVDDVIISPNPDSKSPAASFAIIGVGGFLGIGKKDVAIPMEQIKLQNRQLMLAGATKDALKALPEFQYQKK
jgi:sporulation protein YlmC with PRC-barrel domain